MHDKLKAIFAERRSPKHCCASDVQKNAGPVLDLTTRVQHQLIEYRALLMAVETDPDIAPELTGKLEYLQQAIAGTERLSADCIKAQRDLVTQAKKLNEIMDTAEKDIEAWEKGAAEKAAKLAAAAQ